LADLRRKYGSTLAEVIEFERASQLQLAEFEASEDTRVSLQARRRTAVGLLEEAEERLGSCRRQAAPKLASAVEAHLHELALSGARLEVRIGEDPAGSEVEFLLGANAGEPSLPFAKVASGGSWRGPCSLPAWSCPRHLRRSFSTRSTQAWEARRLWQWAVRCPRSGATTKCWS